MTDELLPCPFCGGAGSVEEVENGVSGVSFSVGCSDDDGHCMGYQSLTTFALRKDAIAAWNKRTAPLKTTDRANT